MRERQRAVADIDVVERIADPGGLDVGAGDPGVRHRLLEGVDHQVFRALVPMFAERRAAHADDGDLVLDAARHASASERRPLSRRRLPEIGAHAAPPVARFDAQPHRNAIADRESALRRRR